MIRAILFLASVWWKKQVPYSLQMVKKLLFTGQPTTCTMLRLREFSKNTVFRTGRYLVTFVLTEAKVEAGNVKVKRSTFNTFTQITP